MFNKLKNITIKSEMLYKVFSKWTQFTLSLLLLMFFIRILFFIKLLYTFEIGLQELTVVLSGVCFDCIFCSFIVLIALPLSALSHIFPRFTSIIGKLFLFIYTLVSWGLCEYYCVMSKPLDYIIFAYTPEEIKEILLSSTSIKWDTILFLFLHITATQLSIFIGRKIRIKKWLTSGLLACCITTVICLPCKSINKYERWYDSHSDLYLATNQLYYTVASITNYKKEKLEVVSLSDIENYAKKYQESYKSYSYPNTKYPFERVFNDNDVLGDFFQTNSDTLLPNFVFIIVEGFGKKLTGVENPSVSFTPFIDSLSSQELYWENCLSSAERTFGALPAIFASAPHGAHGFANVWHPIPDHNTLLKELYTNGYTTSFFYGGSPSFDGQDLFMQTNKVSYIQHIKLDSTQIKKSFIENHRWGLDDAEMFDHAIQHKEECTNRPFADVYLTLTTHEPFELDDMDKYNHIVLQKITNCENAIEKKNIRKNINIFSCFSYMDESIQKLMEYYKSRSDFNNTIFIITGDHRICPLGFSNPITKYHVPLIIYSPMLKVSKKMKGVVSHYDITPSLSAFLSKRYQYKTNKTCHWIGSSFDTSSNFHCSKKQAFMLNNRDVIDYIQDTLLVSNKRLFVVQDNLSAKRLENDSLLEDIQSNLNTYQILSQYAIEHNNLKRRPLKDQ